jgi:hypothetical protein
MQLTSLNGSPRERRCLHDAHEFVALTGRQITDELFEGHTRQFGSGVPYRHVEGANGDTSFAVAAKLLTRHHHRPASERIETVSIGNRQSLRLSGQESRSETLADQP